MNDEPNNEVKATATPEAKTEILIRELVAQVQPVTLVGRPLASFAGWAALAAVWIAAAVGAVGVRPDFAAAAREPAFISSIGWPLALGLAATLAAFASTIPAPTSRRWALMPAVVMTSWLALVVFAAFSTDHGQMGAGIRCVRNLAAFSLPPGLVLSVMLRPAAPLDRRMVGMLAAVGTAALAQVGTRFVCRNDGALHLLAWHCSFVLLLGGAGALLGRPFFSEESIRRVPQTSSNRHPRRMHH